jgi:hypothetical protein
MEEAIKAYLDQFAAEDAAFALVYPSTSKTIEGCCRYIYKHYEEEARKANHARCLAVADADVYGLAVTYFEEDSIKEEKPAEKPAPVKAPAAKEVKFVKPTEKPTAKPTKAQPKAKFVQLELF